MDSEQVARQYSQLWYYKNYGDVLVYLSTLAKCLVGQGEELGNDVKIINA